jgi:F-type H+-transporting ATPase subunit delta
MKLNRKRLAQALVQTASELKSADMPQLVDALVQLLAQHGEANLLRSMGPYLEEAYNELNSIVPVTVTTAEKQTEEQLKDLTKALEEALGKKVDLILETDPSLIGGARIRMGDERIDFSLATSLQTAVSHLSSSHS